MAWQRSAHASAVSRTRSQLRHRSQPSLSPPRPPPLPLPSARAGSSPSSPHSSSSPTRWRRLPLQRSSGAASPCPVSSRRLVLPCCLTASPPRHRPSCCRTPPPRLVARTATASLLSDASPRRLSAALVYDAGAALLNHPAGFPTPCPAALAVAVLTAAASPPALTAAPRTAAALARAALPLPQRGRQAALSEPRFLEIRRDFSRFLP